MNPQFVFLSRSLTLLRPEHRRLTSTGQKAREGETSLLELSETGGLAETIPPKGPTPVHKKNRLNKGL